MAGQAIVTIRDKQWLVSLATTPWELAQGLSGIPRIPAGTGVLSDVGWGQIVTVNTQLVLFPIDIAFLSDLMVVTEVYQNVPPGYLVTSGLPARYVLKVNAGELGGVRAGDRAGLAVLPHGWDQPRVPHPPFWWTQPALSLIKFATAAATATLVAGMVKSAVKPMLKEPKKTPLLPSAKEEPAEAREEPAEEGPRRIRPRPELPWELEYLPDSPEYLTQTVDATGYRSKLDTAFKEAIARVKRSKEAK